MLSKRRLGPWFLFGLLVLLAWASLRIVGVFLDWLLIGLFTAYLTYPMFRWVHRRIRNASLASLTTLLVVVVVVVLPLVLLSIQLVAEVQSINQQLGLHEPDRFVDDLSRRVADTIGGNATGVAGDIVQGGYDAVRNVLQEQARQLPQQVVAATVGLFVLLYVLYYSYVDGPQFITFIKELVPMDEGHRDLLMFEVATVIRAVMLGTVLTALIQAAIGAVGFLVFGVPNVLFWSVLMFILALLPIVGPPIIWAPWGIYLIAVGEPVRGVGLLVYSAILVSTVDNIIRPKLIGTVAKVHPVIILLGVLGGVVVFGFPGFILGPLVLSIFVTILQVYRKEFASRMDDWGAREAWMR